MSHKLCDSRGETCAYVALGGNLGSAADIAARFVAANSAIQAWCFVDATRISALYRSAAVGAVQQQPDFFNAVLELELNANAPSAVELLRRLLAVEAEQGRDRSGGVPGGPRPIDLDLLLVGDQTLVVPGPPELQLPHPRMYERSFVVRPLADLMGDVCRPVAAPASLGELLERVLPPLEQAGDVAAVALQNQQRYGDAQGNRGI